MYFPPTEAVDNVRLCAASPVTLSWIGGDGDSRPLARSPSKRLGTVILCVMTNRHEITP